MGILLAFAPFIVFAVGDRYLGTTNALLAGAAIALALLLREVLIRRKTPKLLEAGTVLLFGGLAAWSLFGKPDWSIFIVRLLVDLGLTAIVLASIVIRRPFTLQYAREQSPKEIWDKPVFIQANYAISTVWLVAFIVMLGADALMAYAPTAPTWIGIAITVAALAGAIGFTGWYPIRMQAKAKAEAVAVDASVQA